MWEHVVYRCVIGSRAYGLATEVSDTDRRGFFLPPADLFWSLEGVPEQIERIDDGEDESYFEVAKFLRFGLQANPHVLECLFTPLIEHATPLVRELLDMRRAFLTKEIAKTCGAYASSQLKKIGADLRAKGAVKWKHAMHLVRVLDLGLRALRTGDLVLDVGEQRERFLAVKRGETTLAEIERWLRELQEAYEPALRATSLPERPDKERVNAWLLRARRSVL